MAVNRRVSVDTKKFTYPCNQESFTSLTSVSRVRGSIKSTHYTCKHVLVCSVG